MSTYHHGDLPTALLKAAGKALEKRGPAALSLREAARRAGVSHNAPYRHFLDREALLAALAAEGFAMLGERRRGKPAREMGEAYVHFAMEQPQRFRLMFGGVLSLAKYPEMRAAAQSAHHALVEAFSELARPELAAAAAWSLVHGLAHLLLDGHFATKDPETFVREVLGAVRFAQRAA
ncbi:MAG TPA: TetR/AcrR family transcriptional regulator [Burkholderiales bacterium]|nr:TetR/AcrR family transcriptional regulator [Burkholderiales bacterium]